MFRPDSIDRDIEALRGGQGRDSKELIRDVSIIVIGVMVLMLALSAYGLYKLIF